MISDNLRIVSGKKISQQQLVVAVIPKTADRSISTVERETLEARTLDGDEGVVVAYENDVTSSCPASSRDIRAL